MDSDFLRIYVQKELGGQTWFSCNCKNKYPIITQKKLSFMFYNLLYCNTSTTT